jgi:hypothetical protein
MSGVFQNTPHRPASVYPPTLVRGENTCWVEVGGQYCILEDASSVLYICKYFVDGSHCRCLSWRERREGILPTYIPIKDLRQKFTWTDGCDHVDESRVTASRAATLTIS